eukprot:14523637-Alexandrium_andersonii.AAC.1
MGTRPAAWSATASGSGGQPQGPATRRSAGRGSKPFCGPLGDASMARADARINEHLAQHAQASVEAAAAPVP